MSKIEELYEEARKNPELVSGFMEAVQENRMEGFLKEHDCSASAEEVQEFLMERLSGTEALSDEELDHVAGGRDKRTHYGPDYWTKRLQEKQSDPSYRFF